MRLSVTNPARRVTLLVGFLAALGAALLIAGTPTALANGVALNNGDVLAAIGSGQVKHFDRSGNLLDTLDTTTGATYTTGMCFDASNNLYVTDFSSDISEFNASGNLVNPTFVSAYPGSAESCTFNASGDMFVGAPGVAAINEYSPSGTLLNTFPATGGTGTGGTDWVDLESDECTLLYTGEGSEIRSINVCTGTQNPDFADGLPGPCFELRVRPNGEVMVACASEVLRLSSTGTVLQTYTVPGSGELFSMNLDPDGTTFWTGDDTNGEVSHIDIAAGTVLSQFNTTPNTGLFGLSIVGGIVVSVPQLTLAPPTQTQAVGSSATVTATLDVNGTPTSGKTILFSVSGANSASGSGTTNSAGQASFSYSGTHGGDDSVTACYDANNNGICDPGEATATATVTWTAASHKAPFVQDSCNGLATSSVTLDGLNTSAGNDVVVAYVSADSPASGGQSVTVSGSGLTWTRIAQKTNGKGDVEIWTANAGTHKQVNVMAKASKKGLAVAMTTVAFENSSGTGATGVFASSSGAPTGSITTTQDSSWVWGVGFDWASATKRTPGAGQAVFTENQDTIDKNDNWVQSTINPTSAGGTSVTINDTAPTTDPYNLALVEVLGK